MDRRLFMGVAIGIFAGPALAQQASSPLDPVKACYNPKVKPERRPYSKRLAALYRAAQKKAQGEVVSGLDFDPTTGSQDFDDDFRKSLKFTVEPRGEGKALVVVKLKVFASEPEKTLHYDVVLEGNAWKVDDIADPAKTDGWRWSTLLEAGAKGQ
ncbi:MAG: YbjP/YqhG family protein [Proteobacteria bacterium]|nr:YbjP/YqhG family protein [Pseudomonadota bacterium]